MTNRVNGAVVAPHGVFGYQPLFFTVTNVAKSVGTANTPGSSNANGIVTALVQGNFEKAILAIETRASIVWVGPRSDAGFVVAIDGSTANAYLASKDDTDVAAALVPVIQAATGLSDVAVTARSFVVS